jgi:glucosyl-dolichyl phosphate glucuronosyltransferase
MKATVVICTLNRKQELSRALDSLAVQSLHRQDFEVMVVDNGSADGTPAFVRARAVDFHNLRVVVESNLGLSAARNRGMQEAKGPIVAFMDDDAEAMPAWLEAHLSVYEADQSVVGVGGPIELVWPDGRPKWLPQGLDSPFSGLDLGDRKRALLYPEAPYGTNMSVSSTAAKEVGGFDLRLGRQGKKLLSYEEHDYFLRLQRIGTIMYEPSARLLHHVSRDRISRQWLLRRSCANGMSEMIWKYIQSPPTTRGDSIGVAAEAVRSVGLNLLRLILGSRKPGQRGGRLRAGVKAAFHLGRLRAWLSLAGPSRKES